MASPIALMFATILLLAFLPVKDSARQQENGLLKLLTIRFKKTAQGLNFGHKKTEPFDSVNFNLGKFIVIKRIQMLGILFLLPCLS